MKRNLILFWILVLFTTFTSCKRTVKHTRYGHTVYIYYLDGKVDTLRFHSTLNSRRIEYSDYYEYGCNVHLSETCFYAWYTEEKESMTRCGDRRYQRIVTDSLETYTKESIF